MGKVKEHKDWINKLYYGDNLDVLRKYIKDETIDLCYIDPPFNSKRNYNQIYLNQGHEDKAEAQAFVDTWEWDDAAINGYDEIINNQQNRFTPQTCLLIDGLSKVFDSKGGLLAYLVHMTLRIAEIQRILKPTGSFYLHCDPTASHYLKIICDSVFCPNGGDFKNEIVWKRRTNTVKAITRSFSTLNDTIFFYVKSKDYYYEIQYEDYPTEYLKRFKYSDKYGKYRWQVMATYSQERVNELKKEGKIRFSATAKHPEFKQYLHELKGIPLTNIWTDIDMINSQADERLGYPTQKPESLLERIINASTSEGDVVLDAYCGCGTTIAVAEKLNRRWIGIDITYQSIGVILKRFEDHYSEKFLDTIELNGVPRDFESAEALAHKKEDRVRKEFEKWAVLSYSNNRAMINEKKGGDGGIDGIALIQDRDKDGQDIEMKRIVFSVKSDKTLTPAYLDQLKGKMIDKDVVMGIFICLYEPTSGMIKMAKEMGKYKNQLFNTEYPKLQIISMSDYFDKGERLNIPVLDVVKTAEHKGKSDAEQNKLF